MRLFEECLNLLRKVIRRDSEQIELDEEIEAHLSLLEEAYVKEGMTRSEARRAARVKFGNVESLKEECRDSWGTRALEAVWRNLNLSFRVLVSDRLYSVAVVGTLGLSIGLAVFVYVLFHGILNRPTPFENEDRVAMLWSLYPKNGDERRGVSISHFFERKEYLQSIENAALAIGSTLNVGDERSADLVECLRVTPSYFDVLGFKPLLGRNFTEEEASRGGPNVVILSYAYWMSRMGGDREALGKQLRIDGRASEIVGILGEDYVTTPLLGGSKEGARDILVPYRFRPFQIEGRGGSRHASWSSMYALLKDGASLSSLEKEVRLLNEKNGPQFDGYQFEVASGFDVDAIFLRNEMTKGARKNLSMLLGAAVLLLLIGCANVSGLVFGHYLEKVDVWRMKIAMGISWGRAFFQMYCDCLVLSVAGSVVGLVGTGFCVALANGSGVVQYVSPGLVLGIGVLPVVVAGSCSILIAFVLAIIVYFWVRNAAFRGSLFGSDWKSTDTEKSKWMKRSLVVSQIAITLALLVGSGLLLKSFHEADKVRPGFDTENLFTSLFVLPRGLYDDASARQFLDGLIEKLSSMPEVRTANVINNLPYTGGHTRLQLSVAGRSNNDALSNPYCVVINGDETLPENLGIPLLRGRYLRRSDGPDSERVCLIDEIFARREFPNSDPIGQSVTGIFNAEYKIVGVVAAAKYTDAGDLIPRPCVYTSYRQFRWGHYYVGVRLRRSDAPFANRLKDVFAALDIQIGTMKLQFLNQVIDASNRHRRLALVVFIVLAGSAFILSSIGLYGLLGNSVRNQTREFGIRMAVGAEPRDIFSNILRGGLGTALTGAAVGSVVAVWFSLGIEDRLYRVSPFDLRVYFLAIALILLVAIGASFYSGLRVTRMDPLKALKDEA